MRKTWTGRDVLGKLSLKTLNQPVVGSYSFGDMSVRPQFHCASVRLERIADKSTETPVVIGATGQTTGWNSAFLYDGGNISGGFVITRPSPFLEQKLILTPRVLRL